MEHKIVLVTGGNGYLGRYLVRALKNMNAKVCVIDKEGRDDDTFIKVDITDRKAVQDAVKKIKPQIVFHLASSLNRNRDFKEYKAVNEINHIGTFNLLYALKDIAYENFIFTSTSEIYGDNNAPFNEDQIPKPVSQYSLTKVYAENLIQTFSSNFGKNYTILRLFNFYGKNMPSNFFIPQMIDALKNKKWFDMTKGEQKRDFLYVDDVVQALLLSATKKAAQNETFNVCSGKTSTLKQLALEVKAKMKSECEIRFGAIQYRNNEVWNMVGDNSKIRQKLNFEVKYDLASGIGKILQ